MSKPRSGMGYTDPNFESSCGSRNWDLAIKVSRAPEKNNIISPPPLGQHQPQQADTTTIAIISIIVIALLCISYALNKRKPKTRKR